MVITLLGVIPIIRYIKSVDLRKNTVNLRIVKMKISTLKKITLASIVSSQLFGGALYASHELEKQPAIVEVTDGHISWHEFRHELGAFSQVNATIDHHGVVTLAGHIDDSSDRNMVEMLASKIRGATDIRSTITSD